MLTVCSQNLCTASTDFNPGTIIDQLLSTECSTRCAISVTRIPVLNAATTASIASGMSSRVVRLQLTAAAAKAPVHKPSIRVLSAE